MNNLEKPDKLFFGFLASGKEPLSLAYDKKTKLIWEKIIKLPGKTVVAELGMMATWLLKVSTNTVTNTKENFAEQRVRIMRKCLDSYEDCYMRIEIKMKS